MADLIEKLSQGLVVWDGAMGTELIASGLEAGMCPERWNVEKPAVIADIYRSYFTAGADVVVTNTFGGTRIRLRQAGLEGAFTGVNLCGVELALAERPKGGLVAGCMGPCGELIAPPGKVSEQEVEDAFAEQAELLSNAGVDLLHLETQFDLREARAAVRGIKHISSLPLVATMTFRQTKRGFFTEMGDPVALCLEKLAKDGVAMVGANCTLDGEGMLELTAEMRRATPLPLLIQPNAGQPVLKGDRVVYPCSPEEFALQIAKIIGKGANAVGGCCGTTPFHIAQIVQLKERT